MMPPHSSVRACGLRLPAIAFLLLVAGFAGGGLALDPSQPFSSYIRTRFSNEDGLPSSVVHEIAQSPEGFLWLTAGGDSLVRFDGRHFTDISAPTAHALALGPDGGVWVGTDRGLERIPATALNQFGRLPATSHPPGPGPASRIICLHFS